MSETDMIQEAEQNAKAIVAYWKTLIAGDIPAEYAIQIISNRLVVSDAIRAVADDVEHVKHIVNDRDERFATMLREMSKEISGMQDLLATAARQYG